MDVPSAPRPVLLACHGWTDSGEVFGPVAQALDGHWTVIAPDAPGHGDSPWTPAPVYCVPDHVTGLAAVVDALPHVDRHRAPVVAYGHSLGALSAARLAAARSGVVAHLILEDPARTTPRRAPSVPLMRTWLRDLQATDHAGRVGYLVREHPDWPADEHGPWARSKAEADPRPLDGPVDWGPSLPVLLAEVGCPVTILRGEPARGGLVSRAGAARCAAVCAGGADVIELGTGHNPRREARAEVLAVLRAVLERCGAGTGAGQTRARVNRDR
ncbi:MAG TPA: alpha/beta fold hydrolase [Kineosporiaceae bacterium]|nr:alpha/beta fold hydrolase [Kineosporiaceae bacterium]